MAQINAYLYLDGTCREAMTFYKECLGGELTIMTVGESPMAAQLPPNAKNLVMHAMLRSGPLTLLASDSIGGAKLVAGTTVSLMLNCTSEEEIQSAFSKLSAGGKVGHPLKQEFWGATYGDFTDRFGVRWMLNYEKPKA
jgi:PhnB protein